MGLCILMEAFFSGSEIAIVGINRIKLKHLVSKGSRRAQALSRILEKPEWLLSTTLVGTTLCTITLNAVATFYVSTHFGPRGEFLAILFTFPLMLVFGEVLPKTLFQRFSERIAPNLVFPLRILSFLMLPVVATVAMIAKGFARLSRAQSSKKTPLMTREELELLFQASEHRKGLKDFERRMVDRIFSFSDRRAKEIMIPLVNVVSLRDDMSIAEATKVMQKSGFSRLLIFSGRAFHVAGWVTQYDLLFAQDRSKPVSQIMRKMSFVPSTTRLNRLLLMMQREGHTLATVVDEYGGAIGLVTLEDVLEEVVGEIEDEHDTGSEYVRRIDVNRLTVNARVPIVVMNEYLTKKIPEGDYETLGGFLESRLQRIPQNGDEYTHRNLLFKVRSASERDIKEVEIVVLKE